MEFKTAKELLDWLKARNKHVVHDNQNQAYVWIDQFNKVGEFRSNKDAFEASVEHNMYAIINCYTEEEFEILFSKKNFHVGHQTYIVKLPDGSFKYDLDKYWCFEDAIIGEWKSKLPLSIERLEEIMKICYPYESYKPKKWKDLVEMFYRNGTKEEEPCVCYKLEEKIKSGEGLTWNNKAVETLEDGFNTSLTMEASRDSRVKDHIYWSICASGEDSAYSGIAYCPFCGRKLPNLN